MSKFRKVAETEGLPDYIEKKFMATSEDEGDIYSHLRESSVRHKQVIARESLGEKQAPKVKNEWERQASAELYAQPKLDPVDENMSNLNPHDISHRAIRRAGYDVDEGENARPGQYQFGTDSDIMTAMIRGASIFETDFEQISQDLIENNNVRTAQFVSNEQKKVEQEARHVQWEQQQINMLKPRVLSSSRANPILRTGMENVSDSGFGMNDYNAIARKEREREAMMNAKREKKMAITRNGIDPVEKQKQWEEQKEMDSYANTYQNYNTNWLDKFGS